MAVRARLNLNKINDSRVINFSYSFNRDIDASGRPSGAVRGGTVQMTIEFDQERLSPHLDGARAGQNQGGADRDHGRHRRRKAPQDH